MNVAMNIGIEININHDIRLKWVRGMDILRMRMSGARTRDMMNADKFLSDVSDECISVAKSMKI